MGFYGLIFIIFEKWIWDKFWLPWFIGIPNISGTWKGTLQSGFEEFEEGHEIELCIKQNWSELIVILEGEDSKSYSKSGSLTKTHENEWILSYEYVNEPKPSAVETMQKHRGLARLFMKTNDKPELERGEYFTGRGRQTHGEMKNFERID